MNKLKKKNILKLNNNFECPVIGLGTCNIKNVEEVVYQLSKMVQD